MPSFGFGWISRLKVGSKGDKLMQDSKKRTSENFSEGDMR
jgi:hypothetical protein